MWLMKLALLVSLFGFYESYAGPKNYGFKVHKHVIVVTEISQENPLPYPNPFDDSEMMAAKVDVKYEGPRL